MLGPQLHPISFLSSTFLGISVSSTVPFHRFDQSGGLGFGQILIETTIYLVLYVPGLAASFRFGIKGRDQRLVTLATDNRFPPARRCLLKRSHTRLS